jgi:carboxymethylenebutenolidase
LIIIHEWWGLNPQIQAVTRQPLAVDLHGQPAATDVKTAPKHKKACFEVKDACCVDCSKEAVAHLQSTSSGEAPRIGVMGWCLGGVFSLDPALALPTAVQACLIHCGKLEIEEEKLQALQAPVLGIFGGADKGIPVASARAFEAALQRLEKNPAIHICEGAPHAFCNPTGNMHQEKPHETSGARRWNSWSSICSKAAPHGKWT